MTTLSLTTRIARNQEAAYTHLDNDMVVMGPKDKLFYGINPVGATIWSLLELGPKSIHDICEKLQIIYDVEPQQCINDTLYFIQEMQLKGILQCD